MARNVECECVTVNTKKEIVIRQDMMRASLKATLCLEATQTMRFVLGLEPIDTRWLILILNTTHRLRTGGRTVQAAKRWKVSSIAMQESVRVTNTNRLVIVGCRMIRVVRVSRGNVERRMETTAHMR